MEGMVKKYQQRFRRVKDEMERWDAQQSRLLSQFRNASSIVDRLQVIQSSSNYGALNSIHGVQDVVLRKQMDSLGAIFRSMNTTLEEFHRIVLSLEKMHRDGKQLISGGSAQAVTTKQLQLRIGIKPSLADCLDGLLRIHDMHQSEYLLKSSVVSALSSLTLKSSSTDLSALHQLLVDQPNIPKEEVQSIFDIIFAEEIC
ncbi:unnamed protein product [Linum tenue]|uniref:Uncharacterized protein n=1 Tax=Linum tenue TaxID=586396 RepID=A0AAV0LKN9_9ROSI|nr:unnamed protein product [Linum tenue]